jgi:hypothetical protein
MLDGVGPESIRSSIEEKKGDVRHVDLNQLAENRFLIAGHA